MNTVMDKPIGKFAVKAQAIDHTSLERTVATVSTEGAAVSKLMKLLIQAYNDPIMACIREYVANGFDAQLASRSRTPLKIGVPKAGDDQPYFTVRDFGLGMSKEFASKLYTQFMHSTKDFAGSKSTGDKGIGSKSALAYTENFQVISFYQGVKYTFVIHWDRVNPFECLLVSEEKTNEASGVLIKIPVKKTDTGLFTQAIKDYFQYIPKSMYELDMLLDIPDIFKDAIYTSAGYSGKVGDFIICPEHISQPKIRAGFCTYPLRTSVLDGRQGYGAGYVKGLMIIGDVGHFPTVSSREAIDWVSIAKEKAQELVKSALDEYLSAKLTQSACADNIKEGLAPLKELSYNLKDVYHGYYRDQIFEEQFKWNGFTLGGYWELGESTWRYELRTHYGDSKIYRNQTRTVPQNGLLFRIPEGMKKTRIRSRIRNMLLDCGVNKAYLIEDAVSVIGAESLPYVEIVDLSEYEADPAPKYSKTKDIVGYRYDTYSHKWQRVGNIPDEGQYVLLAKGQGPKWINHLTGSLFKDVYGVAQTNRKAMLSNESWELYTEDMLLEDHLDKFSDYRSPRDSITGLEYLMSYCGDEVVAQSDLVLEYQDIPEYSILGSALSKSIGLELKEHPLDAWRLKVKDRYPLLYDNYSRPDRTKVKQYMEAMDFCTENGFFDKVETEVDN